MKVKGLSKKISNINSYHLPCSSEEYDELRNGNEVDIEDDVGEQLLSKGLVKKLSSKKSKGDK
tara:strand:+ start:51 stop:239 length:189 start_codon:yes stop_codon:yes gene_type:complete